MEENNRILIVDDSEGIANSLTLILRRKGYDTDKASTGREALKKAGARFFNVILLDIKLPDVNGVQLINQLKAIHPDTAVIVITAYASLDSAVSALNDGAMLYLMKPLNMDLVLSKVEEAIEEQCRIWEGRRSIEALGESEEKFRMMAEAGSDVIYQMDREGRITYCSPAVKKLTGYSQEEVIGTSLDRYCAPGDLDRITRAFRNILSGKRTELLELNALHRDGSLLPVEISTVPLFRNGDIVGAQGIVRDVTERKKAEDALRRRDKILEAVSNAAQIYMTADSWEEATSEILQRIGNAAGVCRVYIFENQRSPEGDILTSQRYEWVEAGVSPQIDNPELQGFPYRAGGFSRWAETLARGEAIWGHVKDFPDSEREVLEQQDIKSIVVAPIFTGKAWWGLIGFDACRSEREWSDAEIDTLKAAAGTLGAAIRRDQTARQLNEQKMLLESLFNNIQEGIGFVDTEENIVFCNPAYARIFEADTSELVGKNLRSFLDDDAFSLILRQTENRRAGRVTTYECPIRTSRGHRKVIRVTGSPRFSETGEYLGTFGAVLDVTEEKRLREELERSEARSRHILTSSPVVLYSCTASTEGEDAHGYVTTFISANIRDIFGYSQEECLEDPEWWLRIIHPGDAARVLKEMAQLFKEDYLSHAYRIRNKGGEYRWIADEINLIREADGRPVEFIGSWMDITEQMRMESALAESEEKYRNLVDNALVGIFQTNLKGEILFANEALSRMAKFRSPAEMMEQGALPRYKDPKAREEMIKILLRQGKIDGFSTEMLTKTGETRYALTSAVLSDGKISGVVIDITSLRNMERELRRSQEEFRDLARHLQSVREEERTDIAREIHDGLGQSLTALKMDLSWLAKRIPGDQRSLLNKIRSMSDLIDGNIRSVKRLSSELRPGLLDEIGLNAAIEWYLESFEDRTGIRCQVKYDSNRGDLHLDRNRATALFRVLQEAMTNVVRHADATRVMISARIEDDRFILSIRDNGNGITEADLSNPRSYGLIGMRERVQPWGGELDIRGNEGKGTTVVVSIPLGGEEDPNDKSADSGRPHDRSKGDRTDSQ
jgi:PAS domain S-box-containing protein